MSSPLNFNFKTRTSQFNTSNINDLAGSLAQAFSVNGSTGIVVNSMNINNLNSTNINTINFTGINANINNILFTNLQIPGSFTGAVLTANNASGNASWSSISSVYNATGTLSGIWTSSHNFTFTFTKVGKTVIVSAGGYSFNTFSAPSAGSFTSSSFSIPSSFAPSSTYNSILYFPVLLANDNIAQIGYVDWEFFSVGNNIFVFYPPSGNIGGGNSGLLTMSFSYNTDT